MWTSLQLVSLLSAGISASPVFRVGTVHNEAAPILSSTSAQAIKDSYIVVFKDHVSHGAAAAHHGWVQNLHEDFVSYRDELRKRSQLPLLDEAFGGLKHTYNIAGSLLGYSGHFDENVIEEIRRHPDVRLPRIVLRLVANTRIRLPTLNRTKKCTRWTKHPPRMTGLLSGAPHGV